MTIGVLLQNKNNLPKVMFIDSNMLSSDILLGQFSIDLQHIGQPDIPTTKTFKFKLKHNKDVRGKVEAEIVLLTKQVK